MTDAQKRAIKHLGDAGGSGVVDRYGRVLAGGETGSIDASTYLRLVASGHVCGRDGRISLTTDGAIAYDEVREPA